MNCTVWNCQICGTQNFMVEDRCQKCGCPYGTEGINPNTIKFEIDYAINSNLCHFSWFNMEECFCHTYFHIDATPEKIEQLLIEFWRSYRKMPDYISDEHTTPVQFKNWLRDVAGVKVHDLKADVEIEFAPESKVKVLKKEENKK